MSEARPARPQFRPSWAGKATLARTLYALGQITREQYVEVVDELRRQGETERTLPDVEQRVRTAKCARCGTADLPMRKRGRPRKFCGGCLVERDAERKRRTRAARAELEAEMRRDLETWRESREYDPGSTDYLIPRLGEFIDHYGAAEVEDFLTLDRGPDGTFTPAGSDDGTSTYFAELGDWLEEDRLGVSLHPWFVDNPHWAFGLAADDVVDGSEALAA